MRERLPRIRSPAVALMLGISVRKVQEMAAAGKLPGAARIGGLWTFDPAKVAAFIDAAEAHAARPRAPLWTTAPMPRSPWLKPSQAIDEEYERLVFGKNGRPGKKAIADAIGSSGEWTPARQTAYEKRIYGKKCGTREGKK